MRKKKVTLRDVSERLGVSQNTASIAIRGLPGVSDKKREEICRVAHEMGYKAKWHTVKRENVCIVTAFSAGADTYYFTNFNRAIEASLQNMGFGTITLHNITLERLNTLIDICHHNDIKAIVIVGDIGAHLTEEVVNLGLLVVCAGYYVPGLMVDSVVEDDVAGILVAVSELKKRHYKRYAFIGGISDQGFFHRWMALEAFLYREKLELVRESCFTEYEPNELSDLDTIHKLLLTITDMPDVFICANDKIAMTLMKALRILGYSIPADVGIVGFDNSDLAKLSSPSLATVDNFSAQQAMYVAQRVHDKLQNQSLPVQRILTPVQFVEGDSIIHI